MSSHTEIDWQTRRNHFNHDWLKNKFLLAMGKFINILDDRIEDDDFEHRFLTTDLIGWETEYRSVADLIQTFEAKMSPLVLFDRPPMVCWPKEQAWLPKLVHQLWLIRVGAPSLVAEALCRAENANATYLKLRESLSDDLTKLTSVELRIRRDQFAQFRDDCRELAIVIEKFPCRIQVT